MLPSTMTIANPNPYPNGNPNPLRPPPTSFSIPSVHDHRQPSFSAGDFRTITTSAKSNPHGKPDLARRPPPIASAHVHRQSSSCVVLNQFPILPHPIPSPHVNPNPSPHVDPNPFPHGTLAATAALTASSPHPASSLFPASAAPIEAPISVHDRRQFPFVHNLHMRGQQFAKVPFNPSTKPLPKNSVK